jgi:hypothetical protein
VNTQFADAFADRPHVTGIAEGQAANPGGNPRLRLNVPELMQPLRHLKSEDMSSLIENAGEPLAFTGGSRFLRACLKKPVDRPPVWFLRQAGRYMAEYREVRKHHTLVEICKRPDLAAEVTITAAEKLGVDAAIIFADLLLPLEPMGLDFEFVAGEGPMVHHPLRSPEAIDKLRVDRAGQLEYVAAAIEKVAGHFGDAMGMIGFCGLRLRWRVT